MMRRDMAGAVHLHKSTSCPADFAAASSSIHGHATSPSSSGGRPVEASSTPLSSLNGRGRGRSTMTSTATMTAKAGPGRPRRRGNRPSQIPLKRKKNPSQSIRNRLLASRWMKNPMNGVSFFTSIALAVMLWYSLGVVSITTSNLLMMKPKNYIGNVPPLYLTLQQLIIGTKMLRFLLHIRFMGSPGIQPWPNPSAAALAAENRRKNLLFNNNSQDNNKFTR